MIKNVIAALDNMNENDIRHFLDKAQGKITFLKIGLETFYRLGSPFVQEVSEKYHCRIFLDLKLHDIPNTVAKAISSLGGLPIDFLTIHLSGGDKMIRSALDAQAKYLPKTKLLGVSYLTSLNDQDFNDLYALESSEISSAFERLFKLALKTNIQGIVCSAHELNLLKKLEVAFGQTLVKVCPGIRFQDEIDSKIIQDQSRVMAPAAAFEAGANYLVMGRSLNQAQNLEARLQQLL